MKFVEDTEQHRQDKARRQLAEWELLAHPSSRSEPVDDDGPIARPSTAATGGRSTPVARSGGARGRPNSAAATAARSERESRDAFFQRLRNDLDRRNRCGVTPYPTYWRDPPRIAFDWGFQCLLSF